MAKKKTKKKVVKKRPVKKPADVNITNCHVQQTVFDASVVEAVRDLARACMANAEAIQDAADILSDYEGNVTGIAVGKL